MHIKIYYEQVAYYSARLQSLKLVARLSILKTSDIIDEFASHWADGYVFSFGSLTSS